MSDNQWVLATILGCIVMLGYSLQAGVRLRAAKREGLSPEDLEYGWETVGVVRSATLVCRTPRVITRGVFLS